MFGLGGGELLIIFIFALIFIGPKKLPGLAKGMGKAIREFQRAKNEIVSDIHLESQTEDPDVPKTIESEAKSTEDKA